MPQPSTSARSPRTLVMAVGLTLGALPLNAARGQTCVQAWQPATATPNAAVWTLLATDAGPDGGPVLYAGGDFDHVGALAAAHVAKFDGTSWSALGSGLSLGVGPYTYVNDLALFDDGLGGGPALYATGNFRQAGSLTVNHVAKWDGTSWSALGTGLSAQGVCLGVFDDGGGPALFVGGSFALAGGVTVNGVAKWDGVTWSALDVGVVGGVSALGVFDDGTAPALYAGGGFSAAGGQPASNVAKWDGAHWSAVGATNGGVLDLIGFDDGTGPGLYAAGLFTIADGSPAQHIARWDGSSWSPLGAGLTGVFSNAVALATHDDGSGPALYACGSFMFAGGDDANHIAKWDGSDWSWLGPGIDPQHSSDTALCMESVDFGAGRELYVGGSFLNAGDLSSNHLARWTCSPTPLVWTYLGSALTGTSSVPYLTGSGSFAASTPCSLTLWSAKTSTPAWLLVGPTDTPTPFKGGLLHPVPPLLMLPFTTGASAGFISVSVPFVAPALPPAFELIYQFAILDPAAPNGFALSNALQSTAP